MAKRKIPIQNAFQLSMFDMDLFETTIVPETDIIDEMIYEEDKSEPLPKEFVFQWASKENAWEQYNWLREHQAEDTAKIEKRLIIENHKGIQVTNGTGVGKSFLALSVANRFFYNNKRNILIVVPTDKKVRDWVEDNNRKFDTIARQISGISDLPRECEDYVGIVVCTYANFYQNKELDNVTWDLIIYDESHRLMENGQQKDTVYMKKHRQLAGLPNHFKKTVVYDNMEYFKNLSVPSREKLLKEYTDKTKVLFLSASPFAYRECLVIGDGSLWNIRESYEMESYDDLYASDNSGSGYNSGGRYENFFIENFGYRMKYNKLTKPDAEVNVALMERNFFEKQVKLGSITGRQIQVDKDYSREFKILNSDIGNKIDEGLSILESNEFAKEYEYLGQVTDQWITWLYKNQLLEAIKAKLAVPRIKKHIKLGRKVVVFHDYKNAEPYHPFQFEAEAILDSMGEARHAIDYTALDRDIEKFKKEYPQLYYMDFANDLVKIEEHFTEHFGDEVVFFNGSIGKAKRSKLKDAFQDDLSGVNIIVVQRQAGKEGIDLHDKTGVYQRVMIDLGLPRRPTDAIQCEGRTYRDGLKSNTLWEYLIINTIFERSTFAQKISERASTAENLAIGNKARNLKFAFKQGYEDADEDDPHLEQGVGGKEKDHAENTMTDFERALTLYYANGKKTSKNKAQEGIDYYATPEPLGLKMVEWADIRSGQRVLEPSAGHGAIARFLPGHSNNYAIEPSRELVSKLRLNCDEVNQDNIYQDTFENYNNSNKFHSIIMNPPFGKAGKVAVEHLEKALIEHTYAYIGRHSSFRSRVIALVPDTPNVDKFINKITTEEYYKSEDRYPNHKRRAVHDHIKLSAEILLPTCTFNRAGTSVMCKILIFDTINDFNEHVTFQQYNFRDVNKVEDFFNEIENLHIPTFVPSDNQRD